MALSYNTFITSLANFLVIPVADPNFVAAIPNIIDDAEQRLYRELDLIDTTVVNATAGLTLGNRNFITPQNGANGPFIVVQDMNVITPSGTTDPDLGTRNPLLPATKEMLNALWPSAAPAGLPQYFAQVGFNAFIVAPWPDANYQMEVLGTARPAPLSPTNTNTVLASLFPDLFLDAALVMGAAFLKDFGAAQDDPKSGMTWEAKYQTNIKSAIAEQARKKFQAQGWTPMSTGPEATPPRT